MSVVALDPVACRLPPGADVWSVSQPASYPYKKESSPAVQRRTSLPIGYVPIVFALFAYYANSLRFVRLASLLVRGVEELLQPLQEQIRHMFVLIGLVAHGRTEHLRRINVGAALGHIF